MSAFASADRGRDLRMILEQLGMTRPVDTVGRVKIPDAKKVESFRLVPDLERLGSMDAIVRELMAKIKAEDERLRRLLPAPAKGYVWRAELTADQAFAFDTLSGETTYRLRYRLVEDPDAGRFGG